VWRADYPANFLVGKRERSVAAGMVHGLQCQAEKVRHSKFRPSKADEGGGFVSRLIVPGKNGNWESPSIMLNQSVGKMKDVRDRLKGKLGDLQYQAIIGPLKSKLAEQIKKDNKGAVETTNWFIAALHRKKKLTPLKHAAYIACCYELILDKLE